MQFALFFPRRPRGLRAAACAHVVLLAALLATLHWQLARTPVLLGQGLLVAGIVEGALLLGWRLTQLPKSQALEFVLVTPLRPPFVLLGEAVVGLVRLGLVTLAGLPLLLIALAEGWLAAGDVPTLLLLPFVSGAAVGLGLATWAYEPVAVRRWGERGAGLLVVLYLVVGVLAGEKLPEWLGFVAGDWGRVLVDALRTLHERNPFGVMQLAMEAGPAWAWPRVLTTVSIGLMLAAGLLIRSAFRLHAHFQDEHYRPVALATAMGRGAVGDEPLTWWAVRRVSRYAGRINLWLAGGFGLVYALYTLAGTHWPDWLGRQVFCIFDDLGGIPVVAAALVLLAAVPAVFQYGLWDSTVLERCRRLELLLLTGLEGRAYWAAAVAAAWRRGRGYFAVALILWLAASFAGKATWLQFCAALASAVVLWGLYFALGFRAFARGGQASRLGIALSLVLPLLGCAAARLGWSLAARWLPPGTVFFGFAATPDLGWAAATLAMGLCALICARTEQQRCTERLRAWYSTACTASVDAG